MRRVLSILLAAGGLLGPALGRAQVRAELIPEHLVIRPGERTRVAIVLRHAPGWHTYWRRGGDAGLPTTVRWTTDASVRIDTLQWPAPVRFVDQGITTFGYDFDVPLVADLIIDRSVPMSRTTMLSGRVEWLACQTQCIPGGAFVDGSVRTGPSSAVNPAFTRALNARAVLWPVAAAREVRAKVDEASLRLTVLGAVSGACRFYPETPGVPADVSASTLSATNRTTTTAVAANRRASLPDTVRGVLRCDGQPASASYHRVPLGAVR